MKDDVFPIYQDIEILPADTEKPIKLNWIIREYTGCEVYKPGEEQPLTNIEDLKIGDKINCWDSEAIVVDTYYAKNGDTGFILEFDKDDRHCWACSGVVNMRGIERASKNMEIK